MKEHTFKEKLAVYAAMATAYLAANPVEADAQIMYTNVNPDVLLQDDSTFIDLNNDGVVDFQLKEHLDIWINTSNSGNNGTNESIDTALNVCMPGNKIVTSSAFAFPIPLFVGDTINQNKVFGTNSLLRYDILDVIWSWVSSGNSTNYFWVGSGYVKGHNKYIGLKILTGGQTNYGWARLDVLNDRIVLKSYAVNITPDSSIIVGDTGTACSIAPITSTPEGEVQTCNNNPVTINITNPNGYSIQWMKDGQWIAGANGTTYTDNQYGDYEILVGDSSCYAIYSLVQIAPFNPPNIFISQIGNLLSSSFNGFNQWYFNSSSNPLVGDTTQYFFPTTSGYYFTEVFFPNGCSVFSDTIYFQYNSTDNLESKELNYSILNKKISFQLSNSFIGDEIIIYNELGQQVGAAEIENENPEIDLSLAPTGIYFYHLRSRNKTVSGKFFLE